MQNGRIKIFTDLIPTGNIEEDKVIIPKIIEMTMPRHQMNVADMQRLKNYYYNKTDIVNKTKVQQSSINNKIGIDYASVVVTTINAYCFANPLTISSRNPYKQEEIKALIDCLDDDSYNQKTMHTVLDSGICGLGYKYVRPATADEEKRGMFFRTFSEIDPMTTYCVYENSLEKEKVLAVRFYEKEVYNKELKKITKQTEFDCWTKYHQWHFVKSGRTYYHTTFTSLIDGMPIEFDAYPILYNRIPIIEYERKQDRTSDFEQAIDLINAINALASYRVDLVEQKSDYILLLRDIDIWADGALSRVKEAIRDGILAFKSVTDINAPQPEVKVLDIEVNQSQLQTLQDFLSNKLEEVTHIPNRDSRTSGSDTGIAVEGRNGYRSLENIAGLVTSCALESENEMFDVILAICKLNSNCPFNSLTTKDFTVKSNRNKVENMINSTQAYSTLRNSGMCDEEALRITNLSSDPISTARLNKRGKEEDAAFEIQFAVDQQKALDSIKSKELGGNTTGT